MFKQTIMNIKPYVPGKPIEEVQRELGIKDVIKLASNENPYGPSPKVIKAMQKAAKNINRYPDGDCFYLKQALAKKLKLTPQELIFTNGSDELIILIVRGFVNEGDEVIIAKPSFLVYSISTRIAGANLKEIPLKEFCYDLDEMKKAITDKTRLIIIGNPDNPGGQYLTAKEFEDFLSGISQDTIVFLDEAYYEYVIAKDYAQSIGLLKKYKNLIIGRTFSKLYGLAGLRIGYGISNSETIGYLNKLREPFNVNSMAQAAALACIEDKTYYKTISKKIEAERKYLYKSLKDLGLEFVKSYTNFVLIKVDEACTIAKKLLCKGVIIRDMTGWGLNGYIRATIGTSKENKRLIKAIGEIL